MLRLIRSSRVLRLTRAVWRHRRRIDAHGGRYQTEVATALLTLVNRRVVGRGALAAYRIFMRLLLVACVALVAMALAGAFPLWRHAHSSIALLVIPLGFAAWIWWLRLAWGAPLAWLDEHADPSRDIPVGALPARLRDLAAESRGLADIPGAVARDLDDLARQAEPHA